MFVFVSDIQWTGNKGDEYNYRSDPLPVDDAEAVCQSYSSHLLGINDITEMEYVINSLMV